TALMALIHPYSLPVVFAFALVVTFVRRKTTAFEYLWRYFAIPVPFAAYEAVLSIINPVLAKHSALGQMTSPSVVSYALGLGFPLLMFVAGLIVEQGQFAKKYWQIALWFFLCLGLAYLPVWFQRKLVFGAQIPLSIIAGVAFGWVLGRCRMVVLRRIVLVGSLTILLPLLATTPVDLLIQQDKEVKE